MNILVSGGAGFIGARLVVRLAAAGHCVRILDNLSPQIHGEVPRTLEWANWPGIELLRRTVTSAAAWDEALEDMDVVIHLAAETGTGQSMYLISRYHEVNAHGTALLVEALLRSKHKRVRRVILASSRAVYGEGAYVCEQCDIGRFSPEPRSALALAEHVWGHRCPTCGHDATPAATRESDAMSPASIYAVTKLSQEQLIRVGCDSVQIDHVILRLQNVYG